MKDSLFISGRTRERRKDEEKEGVKGEGREEWRKEGKGGRGSYNIFLILTILPPPLSSLSACLPAYLSASSMGTCLK